MSPSHVLTCSASSPHQPGALKAKGQRHDDDIWLFKLKRIISRMLELALWGIPGLYWPVERDSSKGNEEIRAITTGSL